MLKPRNRESVLFERKLPHLLYFSVSIVLTIQVFVILPPKPSHLRLMEKALNKNDNISLKFGLGTTELVEHYTTKLVEPVLWLNRAC